LSFYQFRRLRSKTEHSYNQGLQKVKWAIEYLVSLTLCIGSIVFMAIDIHRSGGRILSPGISQNFINFAISSLTAPIGYEQIRGSYIRHPVTALFASAMIVLVIIGVPLYLVNGILSLVHSRTFFESYLTVNVHRGCPGGLFFDGTNLACTSVVSNYIYANTNDDTPGTFASIVWIYGAVLFIFLLLLLPTLVQHNSYIATHKFGYSSGIGFAILTGLITTIGNSTISYTESVNISDCSQATWDGSAWTGCGEVSLNVPGSASGFINIWAGSRFDIVRSIFNW
jgi:hypothetical protein